MFSRFFIDRPIFAAVLSILITLAGALAVFSLPLAQYPPITPPTIQVTCNYAGASAEVIAESVAAPIEQQINGVENMMYMSSQSTNDGAYNLTVTFKPGVNLNFAQVLVQNRISLAMPNLPDVVKQAGVTTRKRSPDILLCVSLYSPDDRYNQLYMSNYALMQIKDEMSRVEGVGDVFMFGQQDYSMRVWLDPERLAVRNLTAGDVVAALREQNAAVATGQVGQPPTASGQDYQFTLTTLGRLTEPEQFEDVVIRAMPDGRKVCLRDVGRVELGAKSMDITNKLDGQECTSLAIFQLPDANALDTADRIRDKMQELKENFPEGLDYKIAYDTTPFVRESINKVFDTLRDAIILVALVVLVFLQNWRSAIIPLVAVPVAIVGTFAVMAAIGFSLNNLTLFGLVLAIGIVVDDAIVVVEAVEHHIEHGMAPRDATIRAMDEVSGPVVAVALVLTAVFVPCAFISGITGQFFRQFALTIAVSTVISAFNSLTLSPALAALLLKPRGQGRDPLTRLLDFTLGWFFRSFNYVFRRGTHAYGHVINQALSGRITLNNQAPVPPLGLALLGGCAYFLCEAYGDYLKLWLSDILPAHWAIKPWLGGVVGALAAALGAVVLRGVLVPVLTGRRSRLGLRGALPIFALVGGWLGYQWLQAPPRGWLDHLAGSLIYRETARPWLGAVAGGLVVSGLAFSLARMLRRRLGSNARVRWALALAPWVVVAGVALGGAWFGNVLPARDFGDLQIVPHAVEVVPPEGGPAVEEWHLLPLKSYLKPEARWLPGALADAFIAAIAGYALAGLLNPLLARLLPRLYRDFDIAESAFGKALRPFLSGPGIVLGAYAFLLLLTWKGIGLLPVGYIPAQDKGYLMISVQLPDSASLERTREACDQIDQLCLRTPGVNHTLTVSGQSFVLGANGSNFGNLFVPLKPFGERLDPELHSEKIAARLRKEIKEKVPDCIVAIFGPPAVNGLGTAGGFKVIVQDRGDLGLPELQKQADNFIRQANSKPDMDRLFTVFRANSPQLFADIDRYQVARMGIPARDANDTLQVYLGSLYVNDFNRFGRTWQVIVQAEGRFRNQAEKVRGLKVRNVQGGMVPAGAVSDIVEIEGPLLITRYNMYPCAIISGNAKQGVSSGQAIATIEKLAQDELPKRAMGIEWTEITYIQLQAGNTAWALFVLAVVLVFLVLAAQYESWSLPLAVILVVPMCILGSIAGVAVAVSDINIFTQIGFVVLVGLASKNAILIVEFAKVKREEGLSIRDATLEACKLRLRPILMTSFAFILGVLPLVLSTGAGAEMRRALGTAVFSGMLGVTLFGIFLTPVFFFVIDRLSESQLFAARRTRLLGTILLYALGLLTLGLFWALLLMFRELRKRERVAIHADQLRQPE